MKYKLTGIVLSLLSLVSTSAFSSDELIIYTELSPPYQMMEDGEVTGLATTRVRNIVSKAGFDAVFQIYPWARAVLNAERYSRALIYSMAKKPERMRRFHWIAPVATFHLAIISLADRENLEITASSVPDSLTVAAQRGDIGADWLVGKGFQEGDNLMLCADIICSWQQLKLGTVDFILDDPELIGETAKLVGLEASDIKVQQIVPELAIEAYLAANKNMPESIVQKLQLAAKELGYRE